MVYGRGREGTMQLASLCVNWVNLKRDARMMMGCCYIGVVFMAVDVLEDGEMATEGEIENEGDVILCWVLKKGF